MRGRRIPAPPSARCAHLCLGVGCVVLWRWPDQGGGIGSFVNGGIRTTLLRALPPFQPPFLLRGELLRVCIYTKMKKNRECSVYRIWVKSQNKMKKNSFIYGRLKFKTPRVVCLSSVLGPCFGGDPSYVTRDIAAHVRLRHRFEYTYADLAVDEVGGRCRITRLLVTDCS